VRFNVGDRIVNAERSDVGIVRLAEIMGSQGEIYTVIWDGEGGAEYTGPCAGCRLAITPPTEPAAVIAYLLED
jgi:hypothetical protein